ncbi:DNA polymerase/3'-5' exonuclease PolX [Listeria booriae]|uniref:DNA polymerase/3'-5' exonuclease PolX n=1 Tax=Listeria booriae TaxID=1552123 RepID=A0A7X1CBJ2_9LIST|nr:DNA polymerase/3'-5' exonuclease PolX [Listeria booriae]MBC1491476.1 DNA polymerase/3'-5' exonuclease PolX [Listeria booriae]MBC1505175.1 DNA polymerase/3'-5' exonuclease PolX [Listeria booriae]MBC1525503.1 DNA polymerase/3'-5' exonuclease PolX [Listeria booriae]
MMNKKKIINLLETIALYMELKGENPFKISAFRKAALALEQDERSFSEIEDFTKISGIGKSTAVIIQNFIETGESEELDLLKKEVPEGLVPLLKVPGLGGKKLSRLYQELGVVDKDSLLAKAEDGSISALKGFGQKSVDKMVEAVQEMGDRPDRYPLNDVLPVAKELEGYLAGIKEIERFSHAGSFRRLRETVKDLDFVIATNNPEAVAKQLLAIETIDQVIAAGDTKVSVELDDGIKISVDFRMVAPGEFVSTLHHFTGSKNHNIRMRQIAKQQSEKINEYGVENEAGNVKQFDSEEAFFGHFNIPFLPPEVRRDGTEIDRISKDTAFVQLADIKGDLHMHTTWSDGAYSLSEMVEACIAKGYEYMVITDHGQFLKVANGLTDERIRKQQEEIRALNAQYAEIEILSGIEMDILPDGLLDFDDSLLQDLDFVIASIHSSFSQSEEEIMKRLRTACENPYVHLIAHPTGRVIGRRDGYNVNVEALIELAAETGTALELNANPQRLDLTAKYLELAKERDVPIAINTDAHDTKHLDFMEIGVRAATKGWLAKENVLNTRSKADFLAFIKNKRSAK